MMDAGSLRLGHPALTTGAMYQKKNTMKNNLGKFINEKIAYNRIVHTT